jgi:hypothetical protein
MSFLVSLFLILASIDALVIAAAGIYAYHIKTTPEKPINKNT